MIDIKHKLKNAVIEYKKTLDKNNYIYANNAIYRELFKIKVKEFKIGNTSYSKKDVTDMMYLLIQNNFISVKRDERIDTNVIIAEEAGINFENGKNIFNRILFPRLLKLLTNNNIIYKTASYKVGKSSNKYKLNDNIISKRYNCKHKDIRLSPRVTKYKTKSSILKLNNIIANAEYKYLHLLLGCIYTYRDITFPTIEEFERRLELAVENGEINKGRVYLNHKQYIKMEDKSKYIDIENSKNTFNYLINDLIFSISKDFGRIYTSFNLLPTIARNMCKLNNNKLVGLDFNGLHLNIAQALAVNHYNHNINDYNEITHDNIANSMNVTRQSVKIDNLSILNRNLNDGYDYKNERWEKGSLNTPTMNYIQRHIPVLYNYILEMGNKGITKFLFNNESSLMDKIAKVLLYSGMSFLYVFDELMVEIKNKIVLYDTMINCSRNLNILSNVS